MSSNKLSYWERRLATCVYAACRWEATAKKPGNVHPEASFKDVCYRDFLESAEIIAPIVAQAENLGVGHSIREAVEQTRRHVKTNTNLGIVLLLAPLAAVPRGSSTRYAIRHVLNRTTIIDSNCVYEAIRTASPGGLGTVARGDVTQPPTGTLREVMSLAAERDRIAEQYRRNFRDVHEAADKFMCFWERTWDLDLAIIELHIWLMSQFPDTLIARKCGWEVAREATCKARDLHLGGDWPNGEDIESQLQAFDEWLRADGHRRNPGTTADLIAAALFVNLREGKIMVDEEWNAHPPHDDDTL